MQRYFIFIIFSLFISFVFSITFAGITYPTPSDCSNALPNIVFGGSCYLESACSHGAVNLTISIDHGFCQATNFGTISSLGITGYGIAEVAFTDFTTCNSSYTAAYSTGFAGFTNDCDEGFWYVTSQGGVLDSGLMAGAKTFAFIDY